MRDALQDVVSSAIGKVELAAKDTVLDIGCNDGTLLGFYPETTVKVGFEPAINVAIKAQKIGHIIIDYFSQELYRPRFEKAKLVTSIAMFYDLEDPLRFCRDVASVMEEGGVWVNQMNYLGGMIQNNAFDNICHEHLEYYSLTSLTDVLRRADLEVFRVETNPVNGGSFRTYIAHRGERMIQQNVSDLHLWEKTMRLGAEATYHVFKQRIDESVGQLRILLEQAKASGKTVYVLGASTRGNTLLQYARLDSNLLKGAVDKNMEKWGRFTPGTWLPIMNRQMAGSPDFFLVLPYHVLEEFKEQEKHFLSNGGRFIVPLPMPRLVS